MATPKSDNKVTNEEPAMLREMVDSRIAQHATKSFERKGYGLTTLTCYQNGTRDVESKPENVARAAYLLLQCFSTKAQPHLTFVWPWTESYDWR